MGGRLGLYEFLGVEVLVVAGSGTRFTESQAETYDDDPGVAVVGSTVYSDGTSATFTPNETYDDDPLLGAASMWSESTLDTRTHNETYDDDPGLDGLGYLTHMGTDHTGVPNETYDDHPGVDLLGVPTSVLENTLFTKVVNETHDDSGLSGLVDL